MAKVKRARNRPVIMTTEVNSAFKKCLDAGIKIHPEPLNRAAQLYYIRGYNVPEGILDEVLYQPNPTKATEPSLFQAMYKKYLLIAKQL